jgi:hypothetical protein
LTWEFVKGNKVDLVDPNNNKKLTTSGQVERIMGEMFHFKKKQKGVWKVVMWQVAKGNIGLFAPN